MRSLAFKTKIPDKMLDIFIIATLTLLSISTLYPFLNIIAKAFSGYAANAAGKVTFYPIDFQFDTFGRIVLNKNYYTAFWVSLQTALFGTLLGLVLTGAAAYALSRKRLRGRTLFTVLFVFTMMFNGGLIPNYILVRSLKLIDTIWALFLPGVISVYNMLILKSSFEGLPESLEESAKLDGATNIRIFFQIMLPISLPVMAAVALFFSVAYWNEYWGALMYINKDSLKPLQLYLLNQVSQAASDSLNVDSSIAANDSLEGVRSSTILASTVPILIIYPFLQKYFVKGITIGSIKE